jgi:hypothetical protein
MRVTDSLAAIQAPKPFLCFFLLKGAQKHTKELLLFYFWTQFFGFFWVIALCWMDVIPGFGQSTSFANMMNKFQSGIACNYGIGQVTTKGCDKVPLIFVLNAVSYVGADVFLICLMAVSEGKISNAIHREV